MSGVSRAIASRAARADAASPTTVTARSPASIWRSPARANGSSSTISTRATSDIAGLRGLGERERDAGAHTAAAGARRDRELVRAREHVREPRAHVAQADARGQRAVEPLAVVEHLERQPPADPARADPQ